jgi:tagaturonate epimerase
VSLPEACSRGLELASGRAQLVRIGGRRVLSVPASVEGFDGEVVEADGATIRLVPTTPAAATQLRALIPALQPRPLGSEGSSFGFGDRLGLATTGHVRALRETGCKLKPVFAQQSVRELERTGRSFQEVLDAATWGALEASWASGFGADADHLRTVDDVASALSAGYTMLTLDLSEHVEASAAHAHGRGLERRVRELPWPALEDDWDTMKRRHAARSTNGDLELARAAAVFGGALAHLTTLSRAIEQDTTSPPDVEISIDETDIPLSAFAHTFLAAELGRLAVRFTSLAPRFPGQWQKGVDLVGEVVETATAIQNHRRVAAEHGSYKLSVHSASDKFSVYPLLAEGGTWHVKTSGTSYLEALRVLAQVDARLFREILTLSRSHLARDRRSYAIAGNATLPDDSSLADAALASLLDDPGARQCLHVTFGTVLSDDRLGSGLLEVIDSECDEYADALVHHFKRHLAPLEALA